MQLQLNHSLAGEPGNQSPPLCSHPTPAVVSHWLDPNGSQRPKEPRWCRPQKAASLSAEQSEEKVADLHGGMGTIQHKRFFPNMVHFASASEPPMGLVSKADS